MKKKLSLISVFVIASILLTACSISITTKVNADGSGELGFAYKFTKDDLSQLSSMGVSADNLCSQLQSEGGSSMPQDFTFKQETHGSETWCIGSKKYPSLDALKTDISGQGFTVNTMEISGSNFTFDGTADMTSTDTGSMPLSITIDYDLTAPGAINKGSSNADKYNGNTATWNLKLGETKSMHLESSTKGGSSGGGVSLSGRKVAGVSIWVIIAIVCCCLLLVVIVVVVVFFFVRRKPQQPTTTM